MTKIIKNWEELAKVPANDKFRIIVNFDLCSGWIVPVWDGVDEDGEPDCWCLDTSSEYYSEEIDNHYFKYHVYLSTHTFYGSQHKYYTKIFQAYGFDIEIDNWDKQEK